MARTLEVKMLLARSYIRGYSKLHGGGGEETEKREGDEGKETEMNRHLSRWKNVQMLNGGTDFHQKSCKKGCTGKIPTSQMPPDSCRW